jgi:hypothetical protein
MGGSVCCLGYARCFRSAQHVVPMHDLYDDVLRTVEDAEKAWYAE